MAEKNPFDIDFDSYIRQGEPDKKEKSIAWAIATGLQQVDGLTPSKYLYETAKRNIEGEITIAEAKKLIDYYYESKSVSSEDDGDKEEADKVSARITELLSEKSLVFLQINSYLFMKDFLREFYINLRLAHSAITILQKKNGFWMAIQFYMQMQV